MAQCRDAPFCDGREDVTDPFNLFHWTALGPDGSLSSQGESLEMTEHWIWNEGCPADITPFEDRRVILLGSSPYARFWQAGRVFHEMVGELTVERTLEPAEVDNWLQRLQAAVQR